MPHQSLSRTTKPSRDVRRNLLLLALAIRDGRNLSILLQLKKSAIRTPPPRRSPDQDGGTIVDRHYQGTSGERNENLNLQAIERNWYPRQTEPSGVAHRTGTSSAGGSRDRGKGVAE